MQAVQYRSTALEYNFVTQFKRMDIVTMGYQSIPILFHHTQHPVQSRGIKYVESFSLIRKTRLEIYYTWYLLYKNFCFLKQVPKSNPGPHPSNMEHSHTCSQPRTTIYIIVAREPTRRFFSCDRGDTHFPWYLRLIRKMQLRNCLSRVDTKSGEPSWGEYRAVSRFILNESCWSDQV